MKRFIDIILAFIMLAAFSPIIVLISIGIFLIDGRPIFFKQTRPGFKEIPFEIIKFRTMKIDNNISVSNDTNRITKLGKFLRSFSIDELPEIWNVLKGDMSFVGPRPLLSEYIELYSKEQSIRHLVKPGITGWAQIHGRNNIPWKQKLDLDIWYVRNHNLILDFKIIIKTISMVLKRKGINKHGFSTTDKFRGNDIE